MALNKITAAADQEKRPSKSSLQTFATIMNLGSQVGGLASGAYNIANEQTNLMQEPMSSYQPSQFSLEGTPDASSVGSVNPEWMNTLRDTSFNTSSAAADPAQRALNPAPNGTFTLGINTDFGAKPASPAWMNIYQKSMFSNPGALQGVSEDMNKIINGKNAAQITSDNRAHLPGGATPPPIPPPPGSDFYVPPKTNNGSPPTGFGYTR